MSDLPTPPSWSDIKEVLTLIGGSLLVIALIAGFIYSIAHKSTPDYECDSDGQTITRTYPDGSVDVTKWSLSESLDCANQS